MRLIGLVLLLTLSWFAVPLVTEAQQAVKVPRLGLYPPTQGNRGTRDFVKVYVIGLRRGAEHLN
jgi:hypothetical protein